MSLDWSAFLRLEGEPDRNFELLWRGVVQRHWERFGSLRSVRQQPGVEFHLRFEKECELGEVGRWYGWQCRWYTLRQDNGFTAAQKTSIKKSIRKTVEYVPGVTDYVLCLKERPAADDVTWYFDLTADDVELVQGATLPRLHLWAEEDLEPRFSGDAAVLRETFFGELVLTSERLKRSRERSLAPIKDRWMPEVNVATEAERCLNMALLRPGGLAVLSRQAEHLSILYADSDPGDRALPSELTDDLARVRACLDTLSAQLRAVVNAASDDAAMAQELLRQTFHPAVRPRQVRDVARFLRALREPSALAISTAEEALRNTLAHIAKVRELSSASCIAVVGDAGKGKSQLAAELTAPRDRHLTGVFIPGVDLKRGGTLDDLVSRTAELRAGGIDDLLVALDAAGARAGQRVPIVIDGLNEAERPPEWRVQLANVEPALSRYPNVLLIVTLRGAVSEEVLIPEAHRVRLEWKRNEGWEAIHRYFKHYKIDRGSARVDLWLLGDPLFLRLFCEAVNGDREHWVGSESIPDDLVAVYELFRTRMSRRIADQLGLRPEFVAAKLAAVAAALWERRARDLPFEEVQEIVDEREWEWDRSLVRALAQEGIISRTAQESWENSSTSILFDRFAGFLIADSLLSARLPADAETLLGSTGLWSALRGDPRRRHPLSDDILLALVGVVPRRLHGRQLWQFAPTGARDDILRMTVHLSSSFLDQETETALLELISQRCPKPSRYAEHPFDGLWDYYDSPEHRLNASFLDRVLRAMPVATRDSRWTEWVRVESEKIAGAIERATTYWSDHEARGSGSDCAALAFGWVATTTNRQLRDQVSLALQRYGRPEPRRLFELTSRMHDVDDPYVVERLLGACLGAALTHQMPDPGGWFRSALRDFLEAALSWYAGPCAKHPTSHALIRNHVRTLVGFAGALHTDALPAGVAPTTLTFAAGPRPTAIDAETPEGEEIRRTLQMDFENYTVGSLYEDRGNYNNKHAGWLEGISEIRGRVWHLGWRAELFADIDDRIAEEGWRRGRVDDNRRTERYGKKYGRIAYYELAGRLADAGQAAHKGWRRLEVAHEFDPTFPADPPLLSAELPRWASQPPEDDRAWYESGIVEVPESLLRTDTIDGDDGPWVLAAGYLKHEDRELGREVWSFLRGMVVAAEDAETVRALLKSRAYLGNHFIPDPPSDNITYAAEMPWSDDFLARGDLGWGEPPYITKLNRHEDGLEFEVEVIAHEYASESGALDLPAYGCDVPSARWARHFDLRQSPGRLDLVGLDGRAASKTLLAPTGFSGNLLYLREDLLARYAAGRALIQIAWGERRVSFDWNHRPTWVAEVAEHADLWRHIELRSYTAG